jgi:isopenicillin-N epimerase
VIQVEIPLPIRSDDDVVEPLSAALGDRTRLVVIDHVTSPTAVVFPVERIAGLCAERGIDVLVDGAHAPGMLDLNVERLGAAYFAGNLHKWVCGPKGAAFLWVRPDRQPGIHPNTISHFLDDGLPAEFGWQGTRDVTAWLCAPDAIDYMERTLGWDAIRRHNHELAVWVQSLLCGRWGVEPGTPPDGSRLGSMVTVALPPQAPQRFETAEALQARLFEKHRIEIPVIEWAGKWWIRASCQVYNTPDQYEFLADTVTELTAC